MTLTKLIVNSFSINLLQLLNKFAIFQSNNKGNPVKYEN